MAEYTIKFPIWRDQKLTIEGEKATCIIVSPNIDAISNEATLIGVIQAVARPGETSVEIIPNSIIADYLRTEFPDLTKLDPEKHIIPLVDYYRAFRMICNDDMYLLKVTNNYSYDANVDTNFVPWTLIRYELDVRMPIILHCVADAYNEMNLFVTANYTDSSRSRTMKFSMPINEDSGTISFVLYGKPDEIFSTKDNVSVAEIQPIFAVGNAPVCPKIKVLNTARRYALYYVDAYGYWRWLIVDGRVKKSDSYQRQTFKRSYDNSVPSNRGVVNYLNNITRTYEFTTGWMTDGQAGLMHHLLGSVNVMLYDMEEETFTPVVLTDSACEYKTYKGEGCGPVTYTITAQLAKDFVRR